MAAANKFENIPTMSNSFCEPIIRFDKAVRIDKKDMDEKGITKIIYQTSKAKKHIEQKKIIKTIFVKNKIINYIISK